VKPTTIALVGNPNCGKTTLFNALTGMRQTVGNWPGVTVDRLEGRTKINDVEHTVVDLPGIYSFSALSIDETIARDYILNERPAVVVNIVDATNLERHLYLTAQLLEMKVPLVVALNMMDVARQRKLRIEIEHLARHLDCPVVPVVASKSRGIGELQAAIEQVASTAHISTARVAYDSEVEEALETLEAKVAEAAGAHDVDPRWLAVKLLEHDHLARKMVGPRDDVAELVASETRRIEKHVGEDIDIVMADGRYGFIHGLTRDVLHRDLQVRRNVSDVVDRVVLNRLLGIPIFLAAMYLMFVLTINVAGPFIDFFDRLCETVFVRGFGELLGSLGSPDWLRTFLADGVGGGIQTVSTFIPPIFFIFLCLSILEDSGYMARAAFVMDRLMRAIGLPGKAFVPMLVGFGCNVPAIMATRTLENRRDRILAILINPFMSCGARLPVYAVFATAFFATGGGGILVFGLYLTGILLAIFTGFLFKSTILRGEAATFVMELPPYHVPTIGGILHHTWHRLKGFIVRAGRVILVVVILLTVLGAVGTDGSFGHEDSKDSVLSHVGRSIAPVFRPMGVTDDNWPATVGLFTGIFAKESVVQTLKSLYDVEDDPDEAGEFNFWSGIGEAFAAIPEGFQGFWSKLADPLEFEATQEDASHDEVLHKALKKGFGGPEAAIAYLLFILTYAPCVAAVAAVYRETNFRWMTFSVLYQTALAWIVATGFYQAATFARDPATSSMWLSICAAAMVVFYVGLKLAGRRMTILD
jgi:ferrous iron transport protein B